MYETIQALEARRLFAMTLFPDGAVDLSGDERITYSRANGMYSIVVYARSNNQVVYTASIPSAGSSGIQIDAGAGNDEILPEYPNSINNPQAFLIGNAGNDTLTGSIENDTLDGSGGNDRLMYSAGDDIVIGGLHVDTFDGSNAGTYIRFNISLNDIKDDDVISTNTYIAEQNIHTIENVVGGKSNDTLYGSAGNNKFEGGSGAGPTGNDLMYGGSGNDTLLGYDGNDTLVGDGGTDLLAGYGGSDSLVGGSGANDSLDGGDGDDWLNVADLLGNTDTANGGAGTDIIVGQDADDVFINIP